MSDFSNNNSYIDLDIKLIKYKNFNKSQIKKFHIIHSNGSVLKYKICNVFAPFGRQTQSDHKTSLIIKQHRLNICWSKKMIEINEPSFIETIRIINELETFFTQFDEFKDFTLISNIIDRKTHGFVIRFHLKTNNNHTTTDLIHNKTINNHIDSNLVSWQQFDKNNKLNFDFHPDSLWIDYDQKKFGISLIIDKVFQFIID